VGRTLCIPLPGNRKLFLRIFIRRRDPVWVTGISAKTPEGYVVFLDYDCSPPEAVFDDVERLQEFFQLGPAYVFQTWARGFHVIIPEVYPLHRVFEIISESNCDPMFAQGYRLNPYRTWVLRCDSKGEKGPPVFIRTIRSPYVSNVKSLGHLQYLASRGVPEDDLIWEPNDGYSGVIIDRYLTKRW